jgi:imidazole glycerol-phosphate synthase subunit HisH
MSRPESREIPAPQRWPSITVVDFGAGNLRSVQRALEATGQNARVVCTVPEIEAAQALILPGVGSSNDAMKALHKLGLVEPLRVYAASGRPFLGVCLGLQLLYEWSEEGGGVECLGLLPGTIRRFPRVPGLKVPQIGWNAVEITAEHPLLHGIPSGTYFYFVHSYYAEPDPAVTLGQAEHGVPFAAIVGSQNVLATQFHPEKSADLGLRIYSNFGRIVSQGRVPAHSRD